MMRISKRIEVFMMNSMIKLLSLFDSKNYTNEDKWDNSNV